MALSPQISRYLNPSPSFHRGDQLPVEQVTWHDAREFCDRLSSLTGETYRLPTEAEWEYACRAGTATEYCFGDDVSELDDYGWYGNNSGTEVIDAAALWEEVRQNATQYNQKLRENQNRTHPVGEKLPNAWGLCDMHGNVWEWCLDEWLGSYNEKSDDLKQNGNEAWGDADINENDNRYCLLRGGSWINNARYCPSANRDRYFADGCDYLCGFRVVCFPVLPRTL